MEHKHKEKQVEMSGEHKHTRLIQNVPVQARYPRHWVRRTILATALAVLTCVLFAAGPKGDQDVVGKDGWHRARVRLHGAWPDSEGISYAQLTQTLLDTPDGNQAREWSRYYTAGPHLAGRNLSQAEWTRDRWLDFGVHSAEVVAYETYINYPVDHRLALLKHGQVDFEATLEEDVLEDDPTTNLTDRVPVFHGYSASGNVTGRFVFANYGTYQDFEELARAGIDLQGKIALVKYGAIFRGLKVKRASELGAIGVVMYSDPGDDGNVTEEKGLKAYPDGPARNPGSVQRGSVQYLSVAPGDPTTPGYPSKPGAPREPVDGRIPDIPSLPISYREALPLLKALNGHGPNVSSFPASWQTGGLEYQGVEYHVGPSPESVTLNLYNEQEYVTTPLWNVIAVINGTLSDQVIVIGNHRDAWVAGGAGDPNSGSAALNEVIRSFGTALAAGWKPHRTIVFASWDGEEYGLIGSTEWVEDHLPWLAGTTVAYINVDVGACGPRFATSAAPVLNKALYDVTSRVPSPNQTIPGQTVRDVWDGHIHTMGSGSDFTAFQDFAGISSIDLGFGSGRTDAVYHYHSNYDSLHWMDTYGDPGFQYHVAIAQVIALLAAKLVEEPIVPLNATDYALALGTYLDRVKATASDDDDDDDDGGDDGQLAALSDPFQQLDEAIASFKHAAVAFDARAEQLTELIRAPASLAGTRQQELHDAVQTVNHKYKSLERQFLHGAGLDGRSWFKHVVFAPGLWTGYAGVAFPGLVEALEARDGIAANKWAGIIARRIHAAAHLLLSHDEGGGETRAERSP